MVGMTMNLNSYGIEIGTTWYRVLPFPWAKFNKNGPDALDKVVAYTFEGLSKGYVFPYRGIWEGKEWSVDNTKVGIYAIKRRKNDYYIRLRRPKTKEETQVYTVERARNAAAAVLNREYPTDKFTNIIQSVGLDGKAFMPPVRSDDDALNALIKTAMRLKAAPFSPYGKMLETYSVSTNPAEGANRKNNSKRSLYKNDTMSMNKAIMYANIWGLDMALVIKDAPDALYPMFEEGTQLVYYPTGHEFKLDVKNMKPAKDYIEQAIEESAESVDEDEMED